jgi:hypothetical protein
VGHLSRRRVALPDSDDDAELVVRWRHLRMFAVPACDPPLPPTHPLAIFAERVHRLPLAGDPARLVALAEAWLDDLDLRAQFEEFSRRLRRSAGAQQH